MLQVEIKGKSADRFRAYAAAKLLRRPTAQEAVKLDLPPRSKVRYEGEEIAVEGEVTTGAAVINGPKGLTITRVVFYKGPRESEVVVGSIDVNANGKIEIEFVEPMVDPAGEPK